MDKSLKDTILFQKCFSACILVVFMLRYYTSTRLLMEKKMAERNLENITITVSKEEKKALKQAALDNECSVSELIRRWLEEYRAKEAEK